MIRRVRRRHSGSAMHSRARSSWTRSCGPHRQLRHWVAIRGCCTTHWISRRSPRRRGPAPNPDSGSDQPCSASSLPRTRSPITAFSAGTQLQGLGTLRSTWRPDLTAATAHWEDELVVDLRSGGYHQLGPVPGAVTVDVVTEYPDGTRKVVSHFSKHHKGLLARTLATSRAEMSDVPALLRVARRAGHTLERTTDRVLTMVTEP